jgi:hypothetical protein
LLLCAYGEIWVVHGLHKLWTWGMAVNDVYLDSNMPLES